MPVVRDWNLALDADQVLWGQGADPAVIRARRPRLADLAQQVIDEGRPLLQPAVVFDRFPVGELRHERLTLRRPTGPGSSMSDLREAGGAGGLEGPLIAQHLAGAREVILAICTVGDRLSAHASQAINVNGARGLALDGLASAAAQSLAESMCRRIEDLAAAEAMQTSIPLNPGMIGWDLAEGQRQMFGLLDAAAIGVSLTASGLMQPAKSVSLAVGLGPEMGKAGRSCDYCAMRDLCRYRGRPVDEPGTAERE